METLMKIPLSVIIRYLQLKGYVVLKKDDSQMTQHLNMVSLCDDDYFDYEPVAQG